MLSVAKYITEPRSWADSMARSRHWEINMRFGTLKVRSVYRTDLLKTVAIKLGKYKLEFFP